MTIQEIIDSDEILCTIYQNTIDNKAYTIRNNKGKELHTPVTAAQRIQFVNFIKTKYDESNPKPITKTAIQGYLDNYLMEHRAETPEPDPAEEVDKEEPKKNKKHDLREMVIDGYEDWFRNNLRFDKNGYPIKDYVNVCNFIDNYPGFRSDDGVSRFSRNSFTCNNFFDGKIYDDNLINEVRYICVDKMGFGSVDDVVRGIDYVCNKYAFNPVKEAIEGLPLWDGVERIETFFIDYIGVKDTQLNRDMTKMFFYAMMKRLYEPGCNYDCMFTVFDQMQGTGKSKILERLLESVGLGEYFLLIQEEDLSDVDTKIKMCESWVVVLDELATILKKDPGAVKTVISSRKFKFRRPYARKPEEVMVPYVLYGNTNKEFFLQDYESTADERRFWVTEANGIKRDANQWDEFLPYDICRQVLAEAKMFFDMNQKYVFNVLNSQQTTKLTEVQFKHKTSRQNTNVQYALDRVLNKMYSKSTFDCYEDFRREAWSVFVLNDDHRYDYGGMNRIDKIPTEWIKNLVNEFGQKYGTPYNVSVQWITPLINKEWIVKSEHYKVKNSTKSTMSCYVRRSSGNNVGVMFVDE